MNRNRIQKLISDAGICSRRKAEILILEKRVKVNGLESNIGDKADIKIDNIEVDGYSIPKNIIHKVLLANKPKGVISTCHDDRGRRTVLDLIPYQLKNGMHTIGRLDLESRGAILITNNGALTQRLTHPSFNHPKTYMVWVKGIISNRCINKWQKGVEIDGKLTREAKIDLIKFDSQRSLLRIKMWEGRNRQIRKVAEKLSYPVLDLQRICIAGIKLNNLKEGDWRELAKEEWDRLIS